MKNQKGEFNMVNRIDLTKREDGYIVSTVKPTFMAWYGKYETAIMLEDLDCWRIAEGYETEEEARIGHEKYVNMSTDEIEKIKWIG